jgi:hypothetical protein
MYPDCLVLKKYGGERGIRTLGTSYGTHDFQSCTFSQLGHLSEKTVCMNLQTASLIPLSDPKIKFFLGENRVSSNGKNLT